MFLKTVSAINSTNALKNEVYKNIELNLHNYPFVFDEDDFEGHDYFSEVGLVFVRFVHVLRVQDIVHGKHQLVFIHNSRPEMSFPLNMNTYV